MIRIEGVTNIVQRIDAINTRFGIGPSRMIIPKPDMDFAKILEKAEEKIEAQETKAQPAESVQQTEYRELAASTGDTGAMIQAAAEKFGVDPRLLSAVAETESGGNQDAVSAAGAIGVMQLMPDTAAGLGVNPYDKQQNIEGGAKYIRQMLDTFGGDVQKAVAAYNAGPQAVRDYGGVPPYRETQNYVNKVMDIYW